MTSQTRNNGQHDDLAGVELEVVDGRQLALMIRVTFDGDCRFQSAMSRPDTIDYLRRMADAMEAGA